MDAIAVFIAESVGDNGRSLEELDKTIISARAIGLMRMRDERGQDDKLIAVHVDDPDYAGYRDLGQLPPHRMREVQRFFLDYKVLEGKEVEVEEPLGSAAALRVLGEAVAYYAREAGRLRRGG